MNRRTPKANERNSIGLSARIRALPGAVLALRCCSDCLHTPQLTGCRREHRQGRSSAEQDRYGSGSEQLLLGLCPVSDSQWLVGRSLGHAPVPEPSRANLVADHGCDATCRRIHVVNDAAIYRRIRAGRHLLVRHTNHLTLVSQHGTWNDQWVSWQQHVGGRRSRCDDDRIVAAATLLAIDFRAVCDSWTRLVCIFLYLVPRSAG